MRCHLPCTAGPAHHTPVAVTCAHHGSSAASDMRWGHDTRLRTVCTHSPDTGMRGRSTSTHDLVRDSAALQPVAQTSVTCSEAPKCHNGAIAASESDSYSTLMGDAPERCGAHVPPTRDMPWTCHTTHPRMRGCRTLAATRTEHTNLTHTHPLLRCLSVGQSPCPCCLAPPPSPAPHPL